MKKAKISGLKECKNSKDVLAMYGGQNTVIPYKGGYGIVIDGVVKEIHFNEVSANKRLEELKVGK